MNDEKNTQNTNSNPIDDVIKLMLKKDAKSCKLANARLSQIKEKEKNEKNIDDKDCQSYKTSDVFKDIGDIQQ